MRSSFWILCILSACMLGCQQQEQTMAMADGTPAAAKTDTEQKMPEKIEKSDAEWKKILTPEQYDVMREEGTEAPFKNKYWDEHTEGTYVCAGCGQELFASATKFDSGTGWPSFWQPIAPQNVGTDTDKKLFYTRTEVHCSRCGAHLGHVFDDGPKPTGLRYCINSVSLDLKPKDEAPASEKPEQE